MNRLTWLGMFAIAAAVLITYIPALHAGYVWDDPDHVSNVPFQGTWMYLRWIWFRLGATPQYYPLTHTTFWLEYHLWGLNPVGYHTVNVLLQIANSLLLWRLLRRLEVPGAWLAAAIFAVHPVHVESVTWVTERKNMLSGLFYLLAAGFALRAWDIVPASGSAEGPQPARCRRRTYLLCLACFVAAMLSKTVTSTFPAAVALVLWWKRGRITRQDLLKLVPFVIVSLGMGMITRTMEKVVVGAFGPDFVFTPAQHLIIAGRAICFYAGKVFWPHPVTFIYPRWNIDPHALWQWAFPAGAAAVVVALWALRRRIGRGPVVAVLFFAGTLFPALGFVAVYPMRFSFVADHFQYLASIGLIALAACVLWNIRWPVARGAMALAVLVPLAVLSNLHARDFKDADTLWRDTLRKNPDCWLAMANIAGEAEANGRLDEALSWYDRSIAAFPRQEPGWFGRATVLAREGRWDEALRAANAPLEWASGERGYVYAVHAKIADILELRGDLNGAAREYETALSNEPEREDTRLAYAAVLQRLKRPQQAIEQYQIALDNNPDSVAVRVALADLLARAGFLQDAMRYTAEALDLRPDPRLENNYGVMLVQTGRPDEAAEHFARAIAEKPDFPDPYDGLGCVREAQGRFKESADLYRKAIALKPGFQVAKDHLAHLQGAAR